MNSQKPTNKSNHTEQNARSLALLALSMIIFGTVGICRRYLPISSGMLAFARGLLGTGFLCVFVKIRGEKIFHGIGIRKAAWLAASGAAIGFNWILLFEAYNYTTVSVATLCYYMQPVFVIFASPFILHEKLGKKKLICAVAAIVGMVLVSGAAEGITVGSSGLRGIICGLGAAALYASVIIMNKKAEGVDAFEKTILQLLSATVIMVPYLIITEDFTSFQADAKTILLVVLMGILHTGAAYTMYFASMENLKAQTIAIFSYIDPVTALILSAVVLQEKLSGAGIAGAILIIGAALCSELHLPLKKTETKQ